ncbi:MAG: phosphoribosylglycinamide formyltransferase [bacterium]
MPEKIRLAVLLSGGGTTFQYIQDRIEAGSLEAQTAVVVSSRADAFGLERAKKHGIPAFAVPRKEFAQYDNQALTFFNQKLLETIEPHKPDLIVLAGFMSLLTAEFVERWRGRIMNTHPALIPAFCGENFYGDKVHKAAVDYGVKITGCTIHFVDELYDHGPIILQQAVPVADEDSYEDVARNVQAAEKPLYCEAIRLFAQGRLEIRDRKVYRR